jgi:hypothetical protein
MIRTGLFRYVRLSEIENYIARAWLIVDDLGEHHGRWSVLMWHCECGEYEP